MPLGTVAVSSLSLSWIRSLLDPTYPKREPRGGERSRWKAPVGSLEWMKEQGPQSARMSRQFLLRP